MRLVIAASALLLTLPTVLLFAGEETTLAARPPSADEVAARILSPTAPGPEGLEKTLAGATPEFLRATLAAIRERVARASSPPARTEAPPAAAPATAPPELPAPECATGNGRGISFQVRFLDMPRDAARAMLGAEPGGAKPVVRSVTADDVAKILDAATKDPTVETVTSAQMVTYDGQRAHVSVLTKVAYIDGYAVEAGTANPIVKNETEGLVLELRPILSGDAKTMRLDLSTTVRQVSKPMEVSEMSLPGAALPVEVQRPEVLTAGWAKSVTIADGGALLVGGWASKDADGKELIRLILLDATSIDLDEKAPELHVGPTLTPPSDAPKPAR